MKSNLTTAITEEMSSAFIGNGRSVFNKEEAFSKETLVCLETIYLTEHTTLFAPEIKDLENSFKNLFRGRQVETIVSWLMGAGWCYFTKAGKRQVIILAPSMRENFAEFLYAQWKEYRELVLTNFSARSLLISEMEFRKTKAEHYFKIKDLQQVFANVIPKDKFDGVIEELIRDDALNLVDEEISYTHFLSEDERLTSAIWTKYRENVLANGF
jgi:hypothetical protein